MLASQKVPTYRSTGRAPLVGIDELWRFARFVAEIMGHEVAVEGIEFAKAQADGSLRISARSLTEGDASRFTNINVAARPAYRFKRSRGALLQSDLAAYDDYISGQIAARNEVTGKGVKQSRRVVDSPLALNFSRA